MDEDIDLTIASVDAVLATRSSSTDSVGVYNKLAVCFQCFESQQLLTKMVKLQTKSNSTLSFFTV